MSFFKRVELVVVGLTGLVMALVSANNMPITTGTDSLEASASMIWDGITGRK